MGQFRDEIVAWIGCNIVPHEADLRSWLRRTSSTEDEISDVIQDAYLCIARLDSVAHIRNPRAYFFQAAKNAVLDRVRHERIVRIERLGDISQLDIADSTPGPERRVAARLELERVRRLIDDLPDRCREIFELRRIHGVPQKEIAARLGLSQNVVEAQAARGLRLIMSALQEDGAQQNVAHAMQEVGRGAQRKR